MLSRDLANMIHNTAEQLGARLFDSTIREAIAIKEAQASQSDIFAYAPKSKVADDYMRFVDEFLSFEK